ncbi:MAG: hypothetical protein HQ557_09640 [Bacteroidetes bacterium]|nr:hypothetical protein [Bacteroidota bacterium]
MISVPFSGMIISIQPRIRLLRSFDESSHSYLGYAVRINGRIGGEEKLFSVGIGKAAQAKHQFKAGDAISGNGLPVIDQRKEPIEYYKVSKLTKREPDANLTDENSSTQQQSSPPWRLIPPELEIYRERGHRRLSARTYTTTCYTCMWGCRMPVEIIIDQWNPDRRKYRFETFCYGPLNCKSYSSGPNRKVEGRNGMQYVEEDWIDEELTSQRSDEE